MQDIRNRSSIGLWLAFLLMGCLIMATFSHPAYAAFTPDGIFATQQLQSPDGEAPYDTITQATAYCQSIRPSQQNANITQFITPLIQCFTDPYKGFIPTVTRQMLETLQPGYTKGFYAAITLAIVLYGIKLVFMDTRNLKGEMFTLAFKIGVIIYFLNFAPNIYTWMINVVLQLDTVVITAMNGAVDLTITQPGFLAGNSCMKLANASGVVDVNGIWATFDCILGYILVGVGAATSFPGIVSLLLLFLFTGGIAIPIFFFIVGMTMTLFFTMVKFAQYFVMAIMGLSFVFVLGYLMMPFILFKGTYAYFQKWAQMCIGYILIPAVMYAFMGTMLLAMDSIIFTGPYAIKRQLLGDNINASANIQCPQGKDGPDTPYCVKVKRSLGFLTPPNLFGTNIPTDLGVAHSNDGTSATNIGVKATDYQAPGASVNIGLDQVKLNMDTMAAAQGHGKTTAQYLLDIFVSSGVGILMAIVTLAGYGGIQSVAAGLTSQGTRTGNQVTNAQVFGEAESTHAKERSEEEAYKAHNERENGGKDKGKNRDSGHNNRSSSSSSSSSHSDNHDNQQQSHEYSDAGDRQNSTENNKGNNENEGGKESNNEQKDNKEGDS